MPEKEGKVQNPYIKVFLKQEKFEDLDRKVFKELKKSKDPYGTLKALEAGRIKSAIFQSMYRNENSGNTVLGIKVLYERTKKLLFRSYYSYSLKKGVFNKYLAELCKNNKWLVCFDSGQVDDEKDEDSFVALTKHFFWKRNWLNSSYFFPDL